MYEIKFDGYRALALRGGVETRVLSRNEKDLGGKFPEVKDSIAALDIHDAIIDGAIVALDEKGRSSFQLLQSFDMGQERPPIVFYAFDLLQLNGKDLQGLPIGKRTGSRYEVGKRSGTWIKIKLHLEQEFVIGGYTEPEGSRKYFGPLLVGLYEGKKPKFAGRVGTGFTEKLLSTLFSKLNKIRIEKCPFFNLPAAGRNRWDQGLTAAEMKRCHWVKPVMVCQIKFTEWTR
jgi:bifunctional non-homologous end joining protein LigD